MNIDDFENRMILALEGELSSTETHQLMVEIESDDSLSKIWKSYQELYEDLDAVPVENPSNKVKERFEDYLNNYERGKVIDIAQKGIKKGPIIIWRKWAGAAAILICVFGFWQLYDHNKSVENTLTSVSQQMETLMLQQSSTDRIKAIRVNYNTAAPNVDDQMINVLIDVMNKDQSSNVRLAAVETLANYLDNDIVREALIKRLQTEQDGGVKLSIITTIGQQKDNKIKTTLENIVNDDSQEKFVIDEAHMQLIRFDKVDL